MRLATRGPGGVVLCCAGVRLAALLAALPTHFVGGGRVRLATWGPGGVVLGYPVRLAVLQSGLPTQFVGGAVLRLVMNVPGRRGFGARTVRPPRCPSVRLAVLRLRLSTHFVGGAVCCPTAGGGVAFGAPPGGRAHLWAPVARPHRRRFPIARCELPVCRVSSWDHVWAGLFARFVPLLAWGLTFTRRLG